MWVAAVNSGTRPGVLIGVTPAVRLEVSSDRGRQGHSFAHQPDPQAGEMA